VSRATHHSYAQYHIVPGTAAMIASTSTYPTVQ
jgi:hypothetical protein